MKDKFYYVCNDCGKEYPGQGILYLCPACSVQNSPHSPAKGILKVLYDYESLKKGLFNFRKLEEASFIDLYPIEKRDSLPPIRVGDTPLSRFRSVGKRNLSFNLHLKDDSANPTFSFKDRASSVVSAFAKEHGLKTIVAASTGNAGSSLAGICASQGQEAVIIVPETAPAAKLLQIMMYGAKLVPVKATYDECFDLSIKASEEFGWYNRNTAYNPVTIEGKKGAAFELFSQLGQRVPDIIFIPVGDGVILSGLYKGFEELLKLGIADHLPEIVAVQAQGSDNLIRNMSAPDFTIKPSATIADSISVDIPRNFYMASGFIRKYKGSGITVTDDEIIKASSVLASSTGIFTEPAGAAAFAGFLKHLESGFSHTTKDVVVLLTGSGLKDTTAIKEVVKMPPPVSCTLEGLKSILK